jgi:hypothetical protein
MHERGRSTTGTTLVFPCSVPEAADYAREARRRGETMVAASSLRYDPAAEHFDTWFHLPSVHDPALPRRLSEAVARYDIVRIYCPHLVAQRSLQRLVAEGRLSVPVFGEAPITRALDRHRALMAETARRQTFIDALAEGGPTLSGLELASLFRHAGDIYGESGTDKIAAIVAALADAPCGDVVEIGVLAGRSTYVLAVLAQHHRVGVVLAVDAWDTRLARQRETPPSLRAVFGAGGVRFEDFFDSFIVSLLPIPAAGCFNYLAMDSRAAHAVWSTTRRVESPHFGTATYRGAIAVLHIDGNHDYAAARADCDLWLPQLLPGGWLILDDYVWLHGDGPHRVGDEILAACGPGIARAFVCDKALFVKLLG